MHKGISECSFEHFSTHTNNSLTAVIGSGKWHAIITRAKRDIKYKVCTSCTLIYNSMIRSITILIVLAVCLGSSAITHAKDTKHLGLLERLDTSHVSSIENYILDQILEKIQTSKQTTDIGKDEKKDKIDKRLRRNRRLEGSTPTSAPVKHKKSNEKTHKKTTTTESSGSMSSSSGSSSSSSSNSSSSSSSSNTFTSSGSYSEAVTSTPTLSYINGQSYSFLPFLSVAIAIGMMGKYIYCKLFDKFNSSYLLISHP